MQNNYLTFVYLSTKYSYLISIKAFSGNECFVAFTLISHGFIYRQLKCEVDKSGFFSRTFRIQCDLSPQISLLPLCVSVIGLKLIKLPLMIQLIA